MIEFTLTADLEKRITSFEMECFRRILNITFRDHITIQAVRDRLAPILSGRDDLLSSGKKRKLKWLGHVSRGYRMATKILKVQSLEAESLEDKNLDGRIMLKSGQDSPSRKPMCLPKIEKLGKN